MASEKKIMNPPGTGRGEKPLPRSKGGTSPAPAAGRCPKTGKNCSTCKVTVCPEEEI